jgi:HK97 family phage portal protein
MLGRLIGPSEARGGFQQLWGSGALFDRATFSGTSVTEETALKMSAVYASVRLISDTISTLPLDQFIRRDGQRVPFRPRAEWVLRPSMDVPRTTFYQQVLISLLLDGNAFVHVMRDGTDIVELQVLNPRTVEVYRANGSKVYRTEHSDRVIPAMDMLHLTEMLLPGELRGVSRIMQAKEALGLGLALEEYAARFFGSGAYAGGVIEWPGEITKEQAREMVDSWEAGHKGLKRSHRPAVMYGGAKFQTTTVDPAQSQMIDQRRFQIEEVARVFSVPPFMLGVTTPGSVSYSSVEQQMLFFTIHTIAPMVEKLEDAFSSLLAGSETFVKFNLNNLVRADLATRTQAYSTALMAGYMSVNDVRALEDARPVENGDEYRVPLQNIPLTDTPLITVNEKARAAQSLIIAGFTPQTVAALLELPLEHSGLPSVQLQPEQNATGEVEPD